MIICIKQKKDKPSYYSENVATYGAWTTAYHTITTALTLPAGKYIVMVNGTTSSQDRRDGSNDSYVSLNNGTAIRVRNYMLAQVLESGTNSASRSKVACGSWYLDLKTQTTITAYHGSSYAMSQIIYMQAIRL